MYMRAGWSGPLEGEAMPSINRTNESRLQYLAFHHAEVQPAVDKIKATLAAYGAFCDSLGPKRVEPPYASIGERLWELHSEAFQQFREVTRTGERILDGEITYGRALPA